ncbi:MAG: YbaN family protein [Bdellovibrionaceae bacterium]|nr:YbaN family protein [Bdellovibrionales bacterium]MCB9085168.1 YbaN family protein [Pseudobdellovibrionaceae bacterium]
MRHITRQTFNFFGWLAFGLGVIGAFLPLVPTTPFMLLAAYFFSKGSPRFYNWLINLKYFGPQIKDWREHGVIGSKAKILANIVLLTLLVGYHYFTQLPMWIKVSVTVVFVGILTFINTRPSKKKPDKTGQDSVVS